MKFKFSNLLKKEYLLLSLMIAIGTFLRLPGVITNSFAFTYDVGRDMLALWNIVYLHKIPLIGATTGLPGIFYGPWWYYLLVPFFIIFQGDPQGIAFMMVSIGVLVIVVGFIFGKSIGRLFLGILFASLISVSPIMIFLSTQIWNPNVIPLFVVLVLFILHKIYSQGKKNKLRYYFILGLLLAFSIDLEIVFGLLLLLGVIFSVVVIVWKKLSFKSVVFFILGLFVLLTPRIFFEFRHQFLMTKSFISFFSGGNSINPTDFSTRTLLNRFDIFFNQFNSTLASENKILGIILILFILITLVFLYKKSEVIVRNFIKTSFIIIATFLFGTIFFSHDIWPHYLVGIPIFYILIFSLCLYLLYKKLSNYLIPVLMASIIFLINLNPLAVIESLGKPMWEGNAAVYRNQLAVIDYVYRNAGGKKFKYVVYTPTVHDFPYRYLFIWYGPKKYHYSPSIDENLAYFILEPDFEHPFRLLDWLEERKGDGKIIKSEVVKGGIVVQTRIH
ncbi:MAG: hypothetical protein Q7K54_00665 [Candidatus Parcubacteria bacterium]|nr:hypothetical protein [Candidatus Parcubacteria bacterium]